jgi:hypothetical protein
VRRELKGEETYRHNSELEATGEENRRGRREVNATSKAKGRETVGGRWQYTGNIEMLRLSSSVQVRGFHLKYIGVAIGDKTQAKSN